jgi:hypothetical protein
MNDERARCATSKLYTDTAARKDRWTGGTAPQMQHRHFAFIAATIAAMPEHVNRIPVAREFAKQLARTNPNFDRDRFLAACRGCRDE